MESMLGKQLSTTDRGAFLERGQQTLCFHAIWDDRQRLYGDIQYYRLFYFLADDTIEILPIHKKNDGRYPSPKLLKRMELPKNGDGSRSEHYSWKDLCIGKVIDVFGRSMLLAKCDSFTRAHYEANGLALKDNLPLEPEEEKIDFVRQIPPYNGFGSEEDSLPSCTAEANSDSAPQENLDDSDSDDSSYVPEDDTSEESESYADDDDSEGYENMPVLISCREAANYSDNSDSDSYSDSNSDSNNFGDMPTLVVRRNSSSSSSSYESSDDDENLSVDIEDENESGDDEVVT